MYLIFYVRDYTVYLASFNTIFQKNGARHYGLRNDTVYPVCIAIFKKLHSIPVASPTFKKRYVISCLYFCHVWEMIRNENNIRYMYPASISELYKMIPSILPVSLIYKNDTVYLLYLARMRAAWQPAISFVKFRSPRGSNPRPPFNPQVNSKLPDS